MPLPERQLKPAVDRVNASPANPTHHHWRSAGLGVFTPGHFRAFHACPARSTAHTLGRWRVYLRLEIAGHYLEFGKISEENPNPPRDVEYVPPPMEVHVGFQPPLATLAAEDD